MKIDENSLLPIYIQIADAIEEAIVRGDLTEGSPCYSQLVLARELQVNPATAAKGINLLVTRGILVKNRGQAMTVAPHAAAAIRERKQKEEWEARVRELAELSVTLGISEETLTGRIHEIMTGEKGAVQDESD